MEEETQPKKSQEGKTESQEETKPKKSQTVSVKAGLNMDEDKIFSYEMREIGGGTDTYDIIEKFAVVQQYFLDSFKDFIIENQKRLQRFRTSSSGLQRNIPVIGVLNNKGGEGKSTYSLALATQLASLGIKTYLVDSDFGTHGLSYYLKGSNEFDLREKNHLEFDDLVDSITNGTFDVSMLLDSTKPLVVPVGQSYNHLKLGNNLSVTLGRTVDTRITERGDSMRQRLLGLNQMTLQYVMMGAIMEYLIRTVNFTMDASVIIVDYGSGFIADSVLAQISHPVFVTDGDLISVRSLIDMRERWVKARKFRDIVANNPTALDFGGMLSSQPFLLLNGVNSINAGTIPKHIYEQVKGFTFLPPLPYSSVIQQYASTYEYIKYLANATPYSLQLLEGMRMMFPGMLEPTFLRFRHKTLLNRFNARMSSIENADEYESRDYIITQQLREDYQKYYLSERGRDFWKVDDLEDYYKRFEASREHEIDPNAEGAETLENGNSGS
ncbi:MAG: AAA family ATPase [SAR324 cluster bacterium]|nr:AAA family ATPase [SAR324 cluster bacterium]